LLERIDTNYATENFILNAGAMINLATCSTPNGVACQQAGVRDDNAPICPVIESTSRFTFVTLRGGGLFVVDANATPMQIVGEYDKATVHPNGCVGAQVGGKMYIDSGGGTAANLFEADLYAFPVTGFSPANPPNVPAPKVVFSEDVDEADAHGGTITKHGMISICGLPIAAATSCLLWTPAPTRSSIVSTWPEPSAAIRLPI
jgi:hypothetical protein